MSGPPVSLSQRFHPRFLPSAANGEHSPVHRNPATHATTLQEQTP